jgi:hypothetical protein
MRTIEELLKVTGILNGIENECTRLRKVSSAFRFITMSHDSPLQFSVI